MPAELGLRILGNSLGEEGGNEMRDNRWHLRTEERKQWRKVERTDETWNRRRKEEAATVVAVIEMTDIWSICLWIPLDTCATCFVSLHGIWYVYLYMVQWTCSTFKMAFTYASTRKYKRVHTRKLVSEMPCLLRVCFMVHLVCCHRRHHHHHGITEAHNRIMIL